MEALEKPRLTQAQLQSFAANLAADDGFKELLRVMKGDVLVLWANEGDITKREQLWHSIQAVGRLENTVQSLAEAREIERRKDEHKKAKRREGS